MNATETKKLLLSHLERYPLMAITDCVKLLYQSEFAGGHIIEKPALSLERLLLEWEATPPDASRPLLEDIGSGLCRAHLAPARAAGISPEALNAAFVAAADSNNGTREGLVKKLCVLRELGSRGETPFKSAELEAWLADYARRGYPSVHHSEAFRANYNPRYRVIAKEYLD